MTPRDQRSALLSKELVLATAGVGIIFVILRTRALSKLRQMWSSNANPLDKKCIRIIETADECQQVVNALKSATANYKVLGFDCEWVTVGGSRRPIALLQLASHEGLCALFRLSVMQQVPKCLRELLENDEVIKVGVGPQDDAQKLSHDYGLGVASTLDLRFLAAITGNRPEGLGKMAKSLLDVHLDKNWRLACSDWEAKVLNEKQQNYAANDALVAVKIFKKMADTLEPKGFWHWRKQDFGAIEQRIDAFLDIRYKEGFLSNLQPQDKQDAPSPKEGNGKKQPTPWQLRKQQSRGIATRSKQMYDNCLLLAPDDELLCTIDRRKAKWYLDQNLGTEVKSEPFTVRLNFEPAGRAVGEVGRYYQTPKANQCVVCGRRDLYIRKNVVPREYRKHFPAVMKTHTSHDVLLLCPSCHQISNISDLKVRMKLAEMCNAPYANSDVAKKCIEVPELKQVRSAACALLLNKGKLPEERHKVLSGIILKHFSEESEITEELLEEAANMDITINNTNYCEHGAKVVKSFQRDHDGLIKLERIWREHFLETMNPKFLPELWNINHNANRLTIRANEGRIDKEDLIKAGLDETLLSTETASNIGKEDLITAGLDETLLSTETASSIGKEDLIKAGLDETLLSTETASNIGKEDLITAGLDETFLSTETASKIGKEDLITAGLDDILLSTETASNIGKEDLITAGLDKTLLSAETASTIGKEDIIIAGLDETLLSTETASNIDKEVGLDKDDLATAGLDETLLSTETAPNIA